MTSALLIACVIAISPISIIAFLFVLDTPKGTRNGAGYLIGWVLCFVAMIVITVTLTGGNPVRADTSPNLFGSIVRIVIGVGLLVFAFRLRRPAEPDAPGPGWMKRVDKIGPTGSALLGAMLQPWPLIAAGAVGISEAPTREFWDIVGLVAFCLIGSSVLIGLEVFAIVSPDRAQSALRQLRAWIQRHRRKAIMILSTAVGVWFVIHGVIGVVTWQ